MQRERITLRCFSKGLFLIKVLVSWLLCLVSLLSVWCLYVPGSINSLVLGMVILPVIRNPYTAFSPPSIGFMTINYKMDLYDSSTWTYKLYLVTPLQTNYTSVALTFFSPPYHWSYIYSYVYNPLRKAENKLVTGVKTCEKDPYFSGLT